MAISEPARKMLWGRSGSRCAICRAPLIREATRGGPESVVGEEAHIISETGPRPGDLLKGDRDGYENRILLCRDHHKIVENEWALSPLRVRGLDRVRLHADLTILAKLATALNRARVPLAA